MTRAILALALALVAGAAGRAAAKPPTAECKPVCEPGFVPECVVASSPTPSPTSTPAPTSTPPPSPSPTPGQTAVPTVPVPSPTPPPGGGLALVTVGNPSAGSWAIEAKPAQASGVYAVFFVDGARTDEWTKPFCSFGDDGATCTLASKGPGTHTVDVEIRDASNNARLDGNTQTIVEGTGPMPSPSPQPTSTPASSTPTPTRTPTAPPTAGPSPTAAPTSPPTAGDPEPPRAVTDTTLPAVTGTTRTVLAGGNVQAALDAAQPGDVVELQAGATFTGNFTLKPKPVVTPSLAARAWDTITGQATLPLKVWVRSTAYAQLPPPGTRAGAESAAAMAKIVSPNSLPALGFVGPANNWYFSGLEITNNWTVTNNTAWQIVALGFQDVTGSDQNATTADKLPDQVVFDRVWVHGQPTGNTRRGFTANTRAFALVDSTVNEIHEVGADNQAVGWWNAVGPSVIRNTWLEAACENFMSGGADTSIPNNTPSDLTFVGNLVTKPNRWRPGHPDYVPPHWSVKNLFELKHVRRAKIDGNTFDGWWPDAQTAAFAFTVRNQSGSNPWATVEDVSFTHNRVGKNIAGSLMNFLAHDSPGSGGGVSQQMTRVLVAQNLFENAEGFAFQVLAGPIDLRIRHNTALVKDGVGNAIGLDGSPQAQRMVFENNIVGPGQYFIVGSNVGVGDPAIAAYAPDMRLVADVFFGPWPTNGGATPSQIGGHPGNFFPANRNVVGFADLAAGNYQLAPGTAYKGKATDGTDPGVTEWGSVPKGLDETP